MAGPLAAAAAARIIHIALVFGLMLATGVLLAARAAAPAIGDAAPAPAVLLPVLLAVAVTAAAVALVLKARIPGPTAGMTDDAWWTANLRRAIPVWALLESAALVGAVFYFIGVGPAGLIVAAAALALLVANGPGRLIDR
ncbi:MAG: hypothetical protein ACREOF_13430 [Gemmatimonadales bacterium]